MGVMNEILLSKEFVMIILLYCCTFWPRQQKREIKLRWSLPGILSSTKNGMLIEQWNT